MWLLGTCLGVAMLGAVMGVALWLIFGAALGWQTVTAAFVAGSVGSTVACLGLGLILALQAADSGWKQR